MVDVKQTMDTWFDKFLEEFCKKVVEEAKNNLIAGGHVSSGELLKSISYKKISEGKYQIIVDKDYAAYLEYGTKAHTIVPKNKKSLKFVIDGKNIFAKRVEHPGTPAMPYMEPAVNYVIQLAERNQL